MKKITKLINGSIVVFVICLIAILTLTGCNNTNSNDNLRKGVDNGIVETEEKESDYIVTKEQFDKAFDFSSVENFKFEYTALNAEDSIIQEYTKDYLRVSHDGINWTYYDRHSYPYDNFNYMFENINFNNLMYNSENKTYEYYSNGLLKNIFKFKYNKISNLSILAQGTTDKYVTVSFTYGDVNFEVPEIK